MMMDKKGVFSIYACLFLVVFMTSAGVFIHAAKKSATNGTALACSSLWSQSIMAEYDLNLKNRYHLFGYYGYPALVQEKLEFYAMETFAVHRDADFRIVSCCLDSHALRNVEVFETQVINWGKLTLSDSSHETVGSIIETTNHQKPDHEILFENLPSEGCESGLVVGSLAKTFASFDNLKDLVEEGTDTWHQLSYIFSHFKQRRDFTSLGETYLQYEAEYIIGGKESDSANERTVKRRIVSLREAVNMAFLQQDPAKSAAIYAAAELLTPGTASVTAQTIMAAWAYAESVNDYNLLIEGYPVPKVKTKENWATDLDAVLADNQAETAIYTGETKGDTYEDYLSLLLMAMDENTRLLRMMDLIQINMRYNYYDTFLMDDYFGGVSYTFNMNGEICHVEETYE